MDDKTQRPEPSDEAKAYVRMAEDRTNQRIEAALAPILERLSRVEAQLAELRNPVETP